MMYLMLIVGFVLLIKGADFFVEGSSAAAKLLKVPSLIIGLTVVSLGTSLPEASVSVSAALQGKNELAVSNVLGSNMFNLMVVCGLCAVLCPLLINKETLTRDIPISIGAAGLLIGLGAVGMTVGRFDGIILLALFIGFLFLMVLSAKKNRQEAEEEYKTMPVWKLLIYIVGGVAAIIIGGKMVVSGASDIARKFGMTENLIGMTIVAIGTSLPELVTSVVAARKKEVDMAIGNAIGSNIFNLLFILGMASAISPIVFSMENIIDSIVLIAMTLLVMVMSFKKKQLNRVQGGIMIAIYSAYFVYICMR